jgi:NitT/TauT family transport system substrate-binding protein
MRFAISLDQSLIIAMEDETRWMMSNNLTNITAMPVYTDALSPEALREVKPGALNIIGVKADETSDPVYHPSL